MPAAESLSRLLALLALACIPCFAGCGDGSAASEADEDYVAESVELFEAELTLEPGSSGVDQETREQGLLFRINVLKSMGPQAAAAAPALAKFRDATQNPELKQAATEALAEIQE